MKAFQFKTIGKALIAAAVFVLAVAGLLFFFQKQAIPLQLSTPSPKPTILPEFSQFPNAPLATAKPTTLSTSTVQPSAIPSPKPNNNKISAALGKQFTLQKNQVATIIGTGLEVTITKFINGPCLPHTKCFWSGQGLELEYRLNGKVEKGLNLTQAFGYQTTVVDNDYTTYATLIVTKQ